MVYKLENSLQTHLRTLTGQEIADLYNELWEAGADMDNEGDAIGAEDWDEWEESWKVVNEEMAGRFAIQHMNGDK